MSERVHAVKVKDQMKTCYLCFILDFCNIDCKGPAQTERVEGVEVRGGGETLVVLMQPVANI